MNKVVGPMPLREKSLHLHRLLRGKIDIVSKQPLLDQQLLSLLYTPGVAEPCLEISRDPELVYEYTGRGNMVAIVTNGTAVLGLGDIGPEAALPIMEGKAMLFKSFAGVNAFPLCLASRDTAEVVRAVELLAPSFGGINLEDIAAPACFEIEQRLKESLDIPVFHDDQHGTAIVAAAGLTNALKLTGKALEAVRVIIGGAGAAGLAIARLLVRLGARSVLVCDSKGVLYPGRAAGMNIHKERVAVLTNPHGITGSLEGALEGADVFIGVSRANLVTFDMVRSMAPDPIIFALANPIPEIGPEEARAAGAAVVATGRSDSPNQINNVLAFPGVFRGALNARATDINGEMKTAAVRAIAGLVGRDLHSEYIIPDPFDQKVVEVVARATARAAVQSGVAKPTPQLGTAVAVSETAAAVTQNTVYKPLTT